MLVTGNLPDFYNETMLPALRAVVDRGYKGRPPAYPQLFNVKSSSRSIEQFSQVSGVNRFQAIDQGGKIPYDQPIKGFNSTFKHSRFGLAVPTTKDVIQDDEWQLIETMHRDLGWSCLETRELDAASTFNNAFTGGASVGPDGVALCSDSHPLYKAGGLQSNLMAAADLDMYSLQLAMTKFEGMKRPSGEYIHVPMSKLLVGLNNRFVAWALLKSPDDPSTAQRSVNPLNAAEDGMPKAFIYRYLTSPNAWFLLAAPQDTGLLWFDREKPYTKSWTDDETEVGIVGMRYKKSHGFNNYIGVVGNAGQ